MMVFGQCIGTAAAFAAFEGAAPRNVDLKEVQRHLVREGIVLGDDERLAELGLV